MGLFNDANELQRKENLKKLEDKRVAFAQKMAQEGFAPPMMLFAQTDNGGFVSLSRLNGQFCLIISPGFGTDEEFQVEYYDTLQWRKQDVHVKSQGMGGIFGIGKKAEIGVEYIITRHDGSEAKMPFVCGRSCWMECKLAKNPLLKTQRRRGDANVVWDMTPLDRTSVERVVDIVSEYFPRDGAMG